MKSEMLAQYVEAGYPVDTSAVQREPRAFPLSLARRGEKLRIAAFLTGKGLGKRLSDLGLHKGSEIEVVMRQMNGSTVVSHGNNRVALGAGVAQMINVVLCSEDDQPAAVAPARSA